MPQPSITKIPLKITYLKFHWNFPWANELTYQCEVNELIHQDHHICCHYANNILQMHFLDKTFVENRCTMDCVIVYNRWCNQWSSVCILQSEYKFKFYMIWKHFLQYWPFVRWIQRWIPVKNGQWWEFFMFSLTFDSESYWINSQVACGLKQHGDHVSSL